MINLKMFDFKLKKNLTKKRFSKLFMNKAIVYNN